MSKRSKKTPRRDYSGRFISKETAQQKDEAQAKILARGETQSMFAARLALGLSE